MAAAAIGAAAAIALPPTASAEPDPHIPDGPAGWCPGGQPGAQGGIRYCLGAPFADGSFYAQTWSFGPGGPFAPGAWHSGASCSVWVNGQVQGGLPGGGIPQCGGGSRFVNTGAPSPPPTQEPYMWQKDPGVWQGPCPPTCP
ncbi:hypothetical protein CQY20_13130 [Mycolicibacterium agri]|nr:hypothetical protein CQY20_13130 [Mycolicibacterium agri]